MLSIVTIIIVVILTEPHVCTGHFATDFSELCQRNSVVIIPPGGATPQEAALSIVIIIIIVILSEPHVCTGHFATDFSELCQRNSMVIIPPVVLRPKRPPSPEPQKPPDSKEPKGKGKDAKDKNPPPPDPEPEQELDENGGKTVIGNKQFIINLLKNSFWNRSTVHLNDR